MLYLEFEEEILTLAFCSVVVSGIPLKEERTFNGELSCWNEFFTLGFQFGDTLFRGELANTLFDSGSFNAGCFYGVADSMITRGGA